MAKGTIAIGADHGGYEAKKQLTQMLRNKGWRVIDAGSSRPDPADYPIYGIRVAEAVARHQADYGILLCRSGNGMAMAANKVHGVRAAIAYNVALAELARQHNEANILVMGADYMQDPAEKVIEAFLATKPEDGRHSRRVNIMKRYDEALASTRPTYELLAHGQSAWLDDISDELIASGELKRLIERDGVRGVTSNPSIFEKAINGGKGRYRAELEKMRSAGASPNDAYEKLTFDDIAAAADILRPLYDETGGDDGFVSLEVLPAYAHDEEVTVMEATRLFNHLNRPNVMIKVPGTPAGIRAFRRLTAAGINVNVTLIFSRQCYNDIARAYIDGLNDRLTAGDDVSSVRSVASVFISRIDTAVDKQLEAMTGKAEAKSLLHKVAIDNTRQIYADFKDLFYGDAFTELAAAGAAVQRPLWGSTSTKNPDLNDVLYVEELVGPLTVNTIPRATLDAFLHHGKVRGNTIEEDIEGAHARMRTLASLGIDIEKVCSELQDAGVKAFADSFDQLFASIQKALAG